MYKSLLFLAAMTFATLDTLASGKQADYYFIHGSMKLLAVKHGSGYKLEEKM